MYNIISENAKIGKNFKIGHFCIIEDNVIIGDNVTLVNYVWLKEGTVLEDGVYIDSYCKTGKNLVVKEGTSFKPISQISDDTIMGKNVFIGPDVVLLRGEIGGSQSPPVIGDDVYIGGCVTVLPGVKIGDRAIIGAGAVVVKDVEADTVVVGNPARVIDRK
ncbi:MAG: DapH/DapD/GlmU-related protein [Candidatus Thorarchaeota archaeon]|jgi:acetyltransferase-like isoleucine patch superfamily enzyme